MSNLRLKIAEPAKVSLRGKSMSPNGPRPGDQNPRSFFPRIGRVAATEIGDPNQKIN
jgi:hypothetical protein